MRQTTLCVPLEVKPESCNRLSALLEELRLEEEKGPRAVPDKYAALAREVPTLHFMSMSVFTSTAYDPIFVLEANFDGSPGVFWGQMEAAFGERLRGILRCCKRPLDQDADLYDSVTSHQGVPIAPYFEARTQKPSAFHHGNRGLARDRILREAKLFDAVRAELDAPGPSPYRGIEPGAVHKALRAKMVAGHPWLDDPPEKRITPGERIGDWTRLVVFAVALLLVLSAPGLALSAVVAPPDLVGAPIVWTVGLGFLSLIAAVLVLLFWLRYSERRDSSHDAPEVDERLRREVSRREDWIVQNHMGSVVLVKPGVLRTLLVRIGHLGLGLFVRATATNGYLGSMRTIHFAHWAFINNNSRLLFFSNFDHSWDSYLDDFIEKAHIGLTMAWSCSVGFPQTRFLILEGATHGRKFKNWGLSTRAVSRFWYSAYPLLSVNQIERNHRIAGSLAAQAISDTEATTWMRDL